MSYLKTILYIPVLLTTLSYCGEFSGLYIGIDAYYNNSEAKKDLTIPDDVWKIHYNVSGFSQGLTGGYYYPLKDNYIAGLQISILTSQAKQRSEHNNGGGSTTDISLNHAAYPMITFGFLPNADTLINVKIGYGLENWSITYNNGIDAFDNNPATDTTGGILGIEMATYLNDQFLLFLSASYSSLSKISFTGGDNQLDLTPATTYGAIRLAYTP